MLKQLEMSDLPPKLSLSIADHHQPTKLHRFRYLKEVKDGRMGSVLHSRATGGKSPVSVTVTVESANTDCKLKVIGCTVFEDLMPHPFYLAGDDCSNGVFEKELSISAAPGSVEEVRLEKVGIVCTPKKPNRGRKKTKGATENGHAEQNGHSEEDNFYTDRIANYNFFKKPPRKNPYQGKDINKLRLAFQVFDQLPGSNNWTVAECKPVYTEAIGDAKIFSEMTVEYVIPKSVSRPDQDVWLYMKDNLPAQNIMELKVLLEDEKQSLKFEIQPKELKKHLVVFNFESQIMSNVSGSFSVTIVEKKGGDSSEPVKLELNQVSHDPPDSRPSRKRARREDKPDVLVDDLQELIGCFLEDEAMLDPDLQELYTEPMQQQGTEMTVFS